MKKYLIIGLLIVVAVGFFILGTKFDNKECDYEPYELKIDSLENLKKELIIKYGFLEIKGDSLDSVNVYLKQKYEKEKNKNNNNIYTLPVDSSIKYWSTEFTKIGIN